MMNKAFLSKCERIAKKNGYSRYEVLWKIDDKVAGNMLLSNPGPSAHNTISVPVEKPCIRGMIKCFK